MVLSPKPRFPRLSSRSRSARPLIAAAGALIAFAGLLPLPAAAQGGEQPPLKAFKVCQDPNNLPFSNEQEEGFENRLARLIAADMKAEVQYTWWAQRRGFVRNTLRAGDCDVIMGIPTSFELARPTRPYYRASYVFVARAGSGIDVRSLDDPILRTLTIGVHVIGDDYANVPPAHALSNRGMVNNVVGYSIYGNYAEPNPPARLIDAVARGEIDLAIAWGPLAGYAAKQQPVALTLTPVTPEIDLPFLPFVFDISLGVRRDDVARQEALDAILIRRAADIDALLDEYGVPYAKRIRRPPDEETGAEKGRLP